MMTPNDRAALAAINDPAMLSLPITKHGTFDDRDFSDYSTRELRDAIRQYRQRFRLETNSTRRGHIALGHDAAMAELRSR